MDWKWGCGGAAFVFVVILVILSIVIVPAGSVGVITKFGAVDRVVGPGLSMKVPIVDGVVMMDTRTQLEQVDASAASYDLQEVTAKIATNYHLLPDKASLVFQTIGPDYEAKVVSPSIQNTFKAVTAMFTAPDLLQKRETVSVKAKELLQEELTKYYIIVDNFNIVNFDFSKEYNAAIEAKQVAQQEVETSRQRLAKAQVDAQTAVAQAQGQADSQKALKDTGALSPEYLQYIAIQKWNGILPSVVGGGATPLLDLSKLTPTTK
jgi:regulator of protease activity HflC (stomatin/prohibitin superfamily)